jgi:hypothetical protein
LDWRWSYERRAIRRGQTTSYRNIGWKERRQCEQDARIVRCIDFRIAQSPLVIGPKVLLPGKSECEKLATYLYVVGQLKSLRIAAGARELDRGSRKVRQKSCAAYYGTRILRPAIESQGGVMGKINYGRVILGGVVGGIVAGFLDWFLNGVLMGQRWNDAVKSLNRPNAFSGAFLFWLFLGFIIGGTLLVWVYAAIRPRFGPGMRTAVYAGLVVWALAALLPNITNAVIGLYGRRLMLYSTLAAIVETVAGAIVGAALYKEADATAAYPAAAEAHQTSR